MISTLEEGKIHNIAHMKHKMHKNAYLAIHLSCVGDPDPVPGPSKDA
jgi:hypothetical protein